MQSLFTSEFLYKKWFSEIEVVLSVRAQIISGDPHVSAPTLLVVGRHTKRSIVEYLLLICESLHI